LVLTLTAYSYAARAILGARDSQEDACQFAEVDGTGTFPLGRSGGGRRGSSLLAVLADGMGGHAGGAEASAIACAAFVPAYEGCEGSLGSRLANALDTSNRAISAALARDPSLAGMGSTLIAAAFTPAGVAWVSVGDSPLLLFRGDKLYQLNEDHSLAPVLDGLAARGEMSLEEAGAHPRRHFLRAALTGGIIDMVDLRQALLPLREDDWLLLASDGIETLRHEELADVMAAAAGGAPEDMVGAVLAAVEAKAEDAQDNATVMAVRVG
jgi:serine/threonine protein phosphatase PrpC